MRRPQQSLETTQANLAVGRARYRRQLQNFVIVLKLEKKGNKRTIVKKVQEYLERAELFNSKGVIPESRNASTGIDNVEDLAGDEENVNDAEKAKLAWAAYEENKKLDAAIAEAMVREKPNVKWSDVAGLEEAKKALKEAIILPSKFPHLFAGGRVPWKGILLYGPPGTGKTFLAKAVATEAHSPFFSVSSADLVSRWIGESEKLVRSLFGIARDQAPSIIFFDDFDTLRAPRAAVTRRIKTEFLVQTGRVGKGFEGVLVLGATNLPWSLDPAMRKRFQKRIYIPLPDKDARTHMFKLNIGNTTNSLSENDLEILGQNSEGYSGADISIVVRETLMRPIRNLTTTQFFRKDAEGYFEPIAEYPPCPYCPMKINQMQNQDSNPECHSCGAIRMSFHNIPGDLLRIPKVEFKHFTTAIGSVAPSVNLHELARYEEWTQQFAC